MSPQVTPRPTRETPVGIAALPGLLIDERRLSRKDLAVAEQHALREHIELADALATTPILVLTSADGPGVEHRVLELGADDYMTKPFEPSILLSRIHAIFRRLTAVAA